MKLQNSKPRVLLAMSGGVDSSVAALLLKKQGYDVIGAFMKCFSDTKNPLTGECNWRSEKRMAIQIASILNIPLITLDFEKQYKKSVVKEMLRLYKKGITPNPDVDCNNKVKFPLLYKEAKKRKIPFIATGHYARIETAYYKGGTPLGGHLSKRKNFQLHRAKDEMKDQSYFLYRLTQKDLSHTLFPIGNYTKAEIREIAKKNNFPNAEKKSTTGICFIGKINVKDYLKKQIKPKKGLILDPDGKKIGEHDGIYFYTIGERIGPRYGIHFEKTNQDPQNIKRWYVAKKDIKKNILILAPQEHPLLYNKEIKILQPHFISMNKKEVISFLSKPKQVNVRIRHVGELLPAIILKKGNKLIVILKTSITGISEGQAIVIYKKNSSECFGGGVIGF